MRMQVRLFLSAAYLSRNRAGSVHFVLMRKSLTCMPFRHGKTINDSITNIEYIVIVICLYYVILNTLLL